MKNLEEQAVDLAHARVAAQDLAHSLVGSPQYREQVAALLKAFSALDNGGAFQAIDTHTRYEDAEDTIARTEAASRPRKDPAEWEDLSGYTDVPHLSGRGYIPDTGATVVSGE